MKNVEIYLMNQYSKLPSLGTSFFYNVLVHTVKVTIENAERNTVQYVCQILQQNANPSM